MIAYETKILIQTLSNNIVTLSNDLYKTKLLLAKTVEALKTIKSIDTHEVLDFVTCEPIDTCQGISAQIAEETLTEIEKELPTS
jgi:hypothetical protein